MYFVVYIPKSEDFAVIPENWIRDIETQREKFLNKGLNRNQIQVCFWTNGTSARNPNGVIHLDFAPNFNVGFGNNFPADGNYLCLLVKAKVDYAEALQSKLKQRGPPPVYNAHRLRERPFPVLPKFANRILSRRMSVPLPLSRAALRTTQQNSNQIPNRVLKRRTSAPPSLKRETPKKNAKKVRIDTSGARLSIDNGSGTNRHLPVQNSSGPLVNPAVLQAAIYTAQQNQSSNVAASSTADKYEYILSTNSPVSPLIPRSFRASFVSTVQQRGQSVCRPNQPAANLDLSLETGSSSTWGATSSRSIVIQPSLNAAAIQTTVKTPNPVVENSKGQSVCRPNQPAANLDLSLETGSSSTWGATSSRSIVIQPSLNAAAIQTTVKTPNPVVENSKDISSVQYQQPSQQHKTSNINAPSVRVASNLSFASSPQARLQVLIQRPKTQAKTDGSQAKAQVIEQSGQKKSNISSALCQSDMNSRFILGHIVRNPSSVRLSVLPSLIPTSSKAAMETNKQSSQLVSKATSSLASSPTRQRVPLASPLAVVPFTQMNQVDRAAQENSDVDTNPKLYRPDHVTTNKNSNSTSGLASNTIPIEIKTENTENEMHLPGNADGKIGSMTNQ